MERILSYLVDTRIAEMRQQAAEHGVARRAIDGTGREKWSLRRWLGRPSRPTIANIPAKRSRTHVAPATAPVESAAPIPAASPVETEAPAPAPRIAA
jgi:hypothetical protein